MDTAANGILKNASTCLQELREECLVERNSPRVLRADCVACGAPAECVPPRHESRASRRADRLHVCAQQQTQQQQQGFESVCCGWAAAAFRVGLLGGNDDCRGSQ
jgi:hypothetical protein